MPPSVVVRECRITDAAGLLSEEEQQHVASAVPKRWQEFLAGRLCARAALGALGVPTRTLPACPDRRPAWPPKVVGSITHSHTYCAAAVTLEEHLAGIGIDIEETERFDLKVLPFVCTAGELARLSVLSPDEQRRAGAVLFSAKESFFKCQYPMTRCWLNFHDVEVHTVPGSPHLSFTVLKEMGDLLSGSVFVGQQIVSDSAVATAVVLPQK